MATNADAAWGTLLKIGDAATPVEAFTTIAEVRDITGPGLTMDTVDVTNHDSTDAWEEVVGTIKRSGNVTFTINYDPVAATHDATTGLLKDFDDRLLRNFQLVFTDTGTTTWAFAAYIVGFTPNNPVAGERTADVSFKLSGEPTLA